MISPQNFALASLLIWLVPLAAFAWSERRSLETYRTRRGITYRRLTTERMLRLIGKGSSDRRHR